MEQATATADSTANRGDTQIYLFEKFSGNRIVNLPMLPGNGDGNRTRYGDLATAARALEDCRWKSEPRS